MPLVDGYTYLNSLGQAETVGGDVKNSWWNRDEDLAGVVWTVQGNWYRRADGSRYRSHFSGLIDDYEPDRTAAAAKLQGHLDLWTNNNSADKLKLIKESLDNLRLRIAMHRAGTPLHMFRDLQMVHYLVAQLEAGVGEAVWSAFPELATARKLYPTLKIK